MSRRASIEARASKRRPPQTAFVIISYGRGHGHYIGVAEITDKTITTKPEYGMGHRSSLHSVSRGWGFYTPALEAEAKAIERAYEQLAKRQRKLNEKLVASRNKNGVIGRAEQMADLAIKQRKPRVLPHTIDT